MIRVLFLAFHGKAFSGKDTAVRIVEHLAYQDTQVLKARFAEPIYQMIRTQVPGANSGMSQEEKEMPRAALGGLSVRQMAVAIGEGARRYRDDSWVEIWQHDIARQLLDAIKGGARKLVIAVPDLRKEAEYLAFYRLAESLMPKVMKALDLRQPIPWAVGTQLVAIDAPNAPRNGQENAATETPLPLDLERDIRVVNDHKAGRRAFVLSLHRALRNGPGSAEQFPHLFARTELATWVASTVAEQVKDDEERLARCWSEYAQRA